MTAIEQVPATPALPPFRLRSSMNGITEAPGKVWFFELAAAVIDADRCIRCGACIAACPTDSLGVNVDDLPYLVKMCTGCSLCWDFCPRGGLRYEATWPRVDEDVENDWKIVGGDPAPGLGVVSSMHAARVRKRSAYRAERSQDGGVTTAILLAALEAGEIDGALLARQDPQTPWRAVPFLAKTRTDIIEAAGSFYNQTLALGSLDLGRFGLGEDARIAVVGTPCEVQGIRAMQARTWRWGASQLDSVVLTIALLCTKSFDYKKLMLGELEEKRGLNLSDVGKVDVIHGRMMVFDKSGASLVDEPVKDFHGAALKGCDECADFLGRGADLSIGSVGSEAGYSSVLVRTAAGAKAFDRVAGELEVEVLSHPEALDKLDKLDKRIANSSLQRQLDPTGPLFIDFAEHLANYAESDTRSRLAWVVVAPAASEASKAQERSLELLAPEPLLLRRNLLLLAADDPTSGATIARRVGDALWRRWRGELEPLAVTAKMLRDVALDYEREIWLWVLGDRVWEQMIDGYRGRLVRRYVGSGTAHTPYRVTGSEQPPS